MGNDRVQSPFDILLNTTVGAGAEVHTPDLGNTATIEKLVSFKFGGPVDQNWRSPDDTDMQSLMFDFEDGTKFDQLVVRVGARIHLVAKQDKRFDNFTITSVAAVPEPTRLLTLGGFAAALVFCRKQDRRG